MSDESIGPLCAVIVIPLSFGRRRRLYGTTANVCEAIARSHHSVDRCERADDETGRLSALARTIEQMSTVI